MRIFKDEISIREHIINIRLAGDGTNIGKNTTILNFSFGFLNEIKNRTETNPNTVTGNFTLGVFKVKSESYEEIKVALKELLLQLEQIKKISIGDIQYEVKFWLGGDLKFLALV